MNPILDGFGGNVRVAQVIKVILETPKENFCDLSGFAYASNPTEINKIANQPIKANMESIVAGPKDGREVFLLHGATTWGYSFRHVVPILAEAGCRVRAADLIGFGRSTKLSEKDLISEKMHRETLQHYLLQNKVKNALCVVFAEGLNLGLRLLAAEPARFTGLVSVNGLRRITTEDYPLSREQCGDGEEISMADIAQRNTKRFLHDNILAGYEAPYPDMELQLGIKAALKSLFDRESEKEKQILREAGLSKNIPAWMACSLEGDFQDHQIEDIKNSTDFLDFKEAKFFEGAGFYLEEDRGPELAHFILDILHDLHL